MLAADAVALVVFAIFLNMVIESWSLLIVALLLGSLGLAGATTLLAAIIARTANKGPLLPVLLFPLLIPLLLSVVRASRAALEGGLGYTGAMGDLQTITLFSGVVITAAVLLFEYVWMD